MSDFGPTGRRLARIFFPQRFGSLCGALRKNAGCKIAGWRLSDDGDNLRSTMGTSAGTIGISVASERCGRRGQRGFALVVVLSALGLLALVAAAFAHVARSHIKLAASAGVGARAEALADAGVHIAILDLVAARESGWGGRRLALDSTPFFCSAGGGTILAIAVQDEAGKVDLNIAAPALIRALVLGLGVGAGEAAVDAILDYRDEDDARRASGAERAEYLAAGRLYGPRNGPFLAVEELASVLGLTQADADRLRPFVTIHSGLTGIDTSLAPRELVDALARGLQDGGGASLSDSDPGLQADELSQTLPPQLRVASLRRAFSIRAQARLPGGATFVREAVVEFVATRAAAYQLRRWHRGLATIQIAPASPELLPPC
jgi:general secretion pathway protein K